MSLVDQFYNIRPQRSEHLDKGAEDADGDGDNAEIVKQLPRDLCWNQLLDRQGCVGGLAEVKAICG
jgi:hypothetical protein